MTNVIDNRSYYDEEQFRVWPDGTVQCCEYPPPNDMSDDYVVLWAYDEDGALRAAKALGYV